jgi:hypothetical protein
MSGEARQLHLFKSKRQRGVAPSPPKEFPVHCALADLLRRWITPGWKFTHLPMGEHREPRTAARLQRMGTTPGWPDFIFVGPSRRIFWLELKRSKRGRLSADQSEMAKHLIGCGFDYLCTNSFDGAVAALIERGILQSRVHVQ